MRLVLEINEQKMAFFLELLKSFEDFVEIQNQEEVFSEIHRTILDERLAANAAMDPSAYEDWSIVKNRITKQYGSQT